MIICRQFLRRLAAIVLAVSALALSADAADRNWAAEMFEKSSHDFGVVARGSDVSYRLKLKNKFEETVHIAEVRTTCGCSAGEPSKETLQSLEEAYITIRLDTRKFTRGKESNLIVVFDRPLPGRVQIPLKAYIRTDVVIEPGSIQFDDIDREKKQERKLKISYAGRNDWTIRDVKTQSDYVDAQVKETARGGGKVGYELIVRLKDGVPVGPLRQLVTLVTDDAKSPHVPLLVEGNVRPEITVTPALVSLGTLRPGQTIPKSIVLRGKKPFDVESVTCRDAKDVFQVRLPQKAAVVQIIPLTITAPSKPGPLDEELTVKIPGQRDPVTFRVFGRVAAPGT